MGSPETGTVRPRSPATVPSRKGCANRGPAHRLQEALLATAVGCRFLLIQVGWDPSLIFDFNKLVRIYFFVCSVSTYVDYYKSM